MTDCQIRSETYMRDGQRPVEEEEEAEEEEAAVWNSPPTCCQPHAMANVHASLHLV